MVVTVVGDDGGASGGGFAEHGAGCPLVTGEPGLPVVLAPAGEPGGAAPDAGLAVWVQPAAPATTTAAIAERRAGRNFRTDIEITVLTPRPLRFPGCHSCWRALIASTMQPHPEASCESALPQITRTLSVVSPQPQLRHALVMIGHLA
jgi:hypothetical protein